MAGSTNFLVFNPTDTANTDTDAAYVAETQRTGGLQNGIAKTSMHNKFYRQVSVMVAALAQYMSNQGQVVSDADVNALVTVIANSFIQRGAIGLDTSVDASTYVWQNGVYACTANVLNMPVTGHSWVVSANVSDANNVYLYAIDLTVVGKFYVRQKIAGVWQAWAVQAFALQSDFTAHLADTVPHGATASATANTIALRDANGNVVSNLPVTGQNPNILFDPSFRLGSAGWTGIGSNGFVVSFGNTGEGTYLFNSTSPSVDPVQINSTPIPLAAGVTVTLSGEIFTGGLSSGLGAFLQIQYYNGTTLLSASEINAPNGVGWTRYSLTVTAPTYCTNVVVVCGIHLGTNTGVGFRKIKLEKGSVATTFSDDNTLNTLQYGGVLPLAQVLSGGNKKQTGSNSMTVATAGTAVHAIITFPVAFATAPTITIGMVSAPSGTSGYINVFPSAATATGMDVYVNSYIAQTIGFNWEATGT